ncbi:hypothetical protein H5410_053292 [Solanum commersonii]|uniref:Uncharacterized protein n=1 Tax=Solanum commersonii TaxID=4109 RepID=A0A9J5X340_SOLCO|nr:hypothetical protein H5410_053292 [Solanum commersonii]
MLDHWVFGPLRLLQLSSNFGQPIIFRYHNLVRPHMASLDGRCSSSVVFRSSLILTVQSNKVARPIRQSF